MYVSISKYMHVIPVWYRRQALKENFGTMKEKKPLKQTLILIIKCYIVINDRLLPVIIGLYFEYSGVWIKCT